MGCDSVEKNRNCKFLTLNGIHVNPESNHGTPQSVETHSISATCVVNRYSTWGANVLYIFWAVFGGGSLLNSAKCYLLCSQQFSNVWVKPVENSKTKMKCEQPKWTNWTSDLNQAKWTGETQVKPVSLGKYSFCFFFPPGGKKVFFLLLTYILKNSTY